MIPIARPVLEAEERDALLEVLASGHLVQGRRVEAFETRFARYLGTQEAVATNSGTAALHCALLALGVGPGDEVIVPAITFFACAAMVAACGATPVVVDVREEDCTLDPGAAAEAVTPATRGLMPVHLFGRAAAMPPLLDLAEERDLFLLEDACQAHGATVADGKVGTLGDAGCFSFYPSKLITTGEGGMVVTDRRDLAETCRRVRNHGAPRKYHHERLGYNYRMTDLAGALGLVQLKKLDAFIEARIRNATYLTDRLADLDGLTVPGVPEGRGHVFYQYVVRVEDDFPLDRDSVVEGLREQGVEARPSYPRPVHRQPAFPSLGRAAPCPTAERVLPRMLEVPVHPSLRPEDLASIVAALESLADA